MKGDPLEVVASLHQERVNQALAQLRHEYRRSMDFDNSPEFQAEKFVEDADSTFNLRLFMQAHPTATYEGLTNFTSEELDELVSQLNTILRSGIRGKRPKISVKGCIFLTLTNYCTYMSMDVLAQWTSLKIPTLQRVIKKVTNTYFPVFIKQFIPKTLPAFSKSFVNYPSAVGAIDTTTIEFHRPNDLAIQKASWDAKHRINGVKLQALVGPHGRAIHVNADFMASTHDKKIFDLTDVTAFVTVQRGVELIPHPILADRGYVGIDKSHPTAIVQQRGKDDDTLKRNNDIAKDRIIVERFFGRFKMSWGAMSLGYRGDRHSMQLIIMGLVALTNFHISLHPLTKDDGFNSDEPDLSDNDCDEDIISPAFVQFRHSNLPKSTIRDPDAPREVSATTGSLQKIQKPTSTTPSVPIVPRRHYTNYQLEQVTSIIGIQNQGLTCHLNAVIHVLFRIPFIVRGVMIAGNANLVPSIQMNAIFQAMENPQHPPQMTITTKNLTGQLGKHLLTMQDAYNTFAELIRRLGANFMQATIEPDLNDLFTTIMIRTNGVVEKWPAITILHTTPDVTNGIIEKTIDVNIFLPPPFLVVNLGRPAETDSLRVYQVPISFPLNLDLSHVSRNANRLYELQSIVAYASIHYIVFTKITDTWYIIDDESVFKIDESHLAGLEGGFSQHGKKPAQIDEEIANHPLWRFTKPYRWVAKVLFYKEVNA